MGAGAGVRPFEPCYQPFTGSRHHAAQSREGTRFAGTGCHSRERMSSRKRGAGIHFNQENLWIPAFAGMTGFREACLLPERPPRLGSAFPADKGQPGRTSVRSGFFRSRRAAGRPGLRMRIACIHDPERLYPAAVRSMPILVPRAIMQTSAATVRDGARRDGATVTPSTVRRLASSAPSHIRPRLSSPALLRTPPRR